jgi:hypothetical protein
MNDRDLLQALLSNQGYKGYRIHLLAGDYYPEHWRGFWASCVKGQGRYAGSGTVVSYKHVGRAFGYVKKQLTALVPDGQAGEEEPAPGPGDAQKGGSL